MAPPNSAPPGFQRLDHVAIVARTMIAVTGLDRVMLDRGLRLAHAAAFRLQFGKAHLAVRIEKHQVGKAGMTPIRFSLGLLSPGRAFPLAMCG